MGCGDGTLLKHVYQLIRDKTLRGGYLDSFPLLMVGADFSPESLRVTGATLESAGIPHELVHADIGEQVWRALYPCTIS